ncbi:MAG: twin-arginine translocation signal domain-containing protein [Anaerolineae bacterium]|nr:twin-arginine translocation signal domain-containing protein [Anaerolineae bacterium]
MNTPSTPQTHLSRRRFLKILAVTGAAGVTVAGGYALFEYAPWLDYDQHASDNRRPFAAEANLTAAPMYELIRYASLAANGHNTQPWKFALKESAVEIHPDYSRRLPVVDPNDRELWISLGCALENLLIAARTVGYATEVIYPEAEDVIQVRLTADRPQDAPLFNAIPLRQSNRSEYDGQPVSTAELDQLAASPLEPGVVLHIVTQAAEMERLLEYVNQGNLSQYADKPFVDELISWLRFTKKEALASLDGLYTPCSGNPEVPRWLGQMFVGGTDPQQQADTDAQKLRSSSGALVLASESDTKAAWVRTGQVVERLALTMTSLNIQSAFLNQPIEVMSLRSEFQSALALDKSQPQLLVRFGHGAVMPKSLRRPVDQILLPS